MPLEYLFLFEAGMCLPAVEAVYGRCVYNLAGVRCRLADRVLSSCPPPLAIGLVLLWAAILIWLAVNRFEQNHEHDVRQVVLSLYFNGHLVYGLCAFIGWKLGQKRRWRRVLKLYFRRLAGG